MKAPVCEQCAGSGLLCPACTKKIEQHEISKTDIDIARVLYKIEKKSVVMDFELKKSVQLDGFILVLAAGNIAPLIGKGGRIVRLISEEIGKKVRIVAEGDFKDMIQDLVFPARVHGVNILHSQEGEEYKVFLSYKDKSKLVLDDDALQKAMNYLAKSRVDIKYK